MADSSDRSAQERPVVTRPAPPSVERDSRYAAGETLAALAEAGGDMPVSELPVRSHDVDRLRSEGLIAEVGGPSYSLTWTGWEWCENAADVETRIRAIHRGLRLDDPDLQEVGLGDIRDALVRGNPVARIDVDFTLRALHHARRITLVPSGPVLSSEERDAAVSVDGELRHRVVVQVGAPRLFEVANPFGATGCPGGEAGTQAARDHLPSYAQGAGPRAGGLRRTSGADGSAGVSNEVRR
jgi:hypothetical protein